MASGASSPRPHARNFRQAPCRGSARLGKRRFFLVEHAHHIRQILDIRQVGQCFGITGVEQLSLVIYQEEGGQLQLASLILPVLQAERLGARQLFGKPTDSMVMRDLAQGMSNLR